MDIYFVYCHFLASREAYTVRSKPKKAQYSVLFTAESLKDLK